MPRMSRFYRKKRKKTKPIIFAVPRRYRRNSKSLMALGVIFICGLIVLILLVKLFFAAISAIRIDIKDVEAMRIPGKEISYINEIAAEQRTDQYIALTAYLIYNRFFEEKQMPKTKEQLKSDFFPRIEKIKGQMSERRFNKYYNLVETLMTEMQVFPVPEGYTGEQIMFGDTWNTKKNICGKGLHMATDIYDRENQPGRISVVSMTSGVVEAKGKNQSGDWHVGIRTEKGTYYYYDHFDRVPDYLEIGTTVTAGMLLGYMGNGGRSETLDIKGNFVTNIHVGIKVNSDLKKKNFWINPYPFLRYLEDSRTEIIK